LPMAGQRAQSRASLAVRRAIVQENVFLTSSFNKKSLEKPISLGSPLAIRTCRQHEIGTVAEATMIQAQQREAGRGGRLTQPLSGRSTQIPRLPELNAPRLYPGREIGAYRLIGLLGSGGVGEVWRADHVLLDRPAAIKFLRLSQSKNAAGIVRR